MWPFKESRKPINAGSQVEYVICPHCQQGMHVEMNLQVEFQRTSVEITWTVEGVRR